MIRKEYINEYTLTKFVWSVFATAKEDGMRLSHVGLYIYITQINQTLKWSEFFKLPSGQTSDQCGVTYKTYIKLFEDLERFGLLKTVKESHNQHEARTITIQTELLRTYIEGGGAIAAR